MFVHLRWLMVCFCGLGYGFCALRCFVDVWFTGRFCGFVWYGNF